MKTKLSCVTFLVLFLVLPLLVFAQEEITITTYYPSPYGVYRTLRLYPNTETAFSVGNPCDKPGEMSYDADTNKVLLCDGSVNKWVEFSGSNYWTYDTAPNPDVLYATDLNAFVGIGTNSPTAKLHVVQNYPDPPGGVSSILRLQGGTLVDLIVRKWAPSPSTVDLAVIEHIRGSRHIALNPLGGIVSIGLIAPQGNLLNIGGQLVFHKPPGLTGVNQRIEVHILNSSAPPIPVFSIGYNGHVAFGTYYPGNYPFVVNGQAAFLGLAAGAGTPLHIDGNSRLVRNTSSKRYKENIKDLGAEFPKLLELKPIRFQWKESKQEDIGLIAEDVDAVIKDLVVYDKEGNPDAVKYDKISLYLLGLMKEQQGQISRMRVEIDELKKKLERK